MDNHTHRYGRREKDRIKSQSDDSYSDNLDPKMGIY